MGVHRQNFALSEASMNFMCFKGVLNVVALLEILLLSRGHEGQDS